MKDPFRFAPELLEYRNDVIAELADSGFHWLSHYSAVDTLHDVYGIEVCGIQEQGDADQMLRLLIRIFPSWRPRCLYYKDYGREPGWKATIQRDPDGPDEQWETA